MTVADLICALTQHPMDSEIRVYLDGDVYQMDRLLIRTEPMDVVRHERRYGDALRFVDYADNLTLIEVKP